MAFCSLILSLMVYLLFFIDWHSSMSLLGPSQISCMILFKLSSLSLHVDSSVNGFGSKLFCCLFEIVRNRSTYGLLRLCFMKCPELVVTSSVLQRWNVSCWRKYLNDNQAFMKTWNLFNCYCNCQLQNVHCETGLL